MAQNDKYSFKDFMNKTFLDANPAEFNNTVIRGSCFYQEGPSADGLVNIFPEGMVGVTFDRCNLDNVYVPTGNAIKTSSSNRVIKAQNDLEDWVCDKLGLPQEPVSKQAFIELGISVDPQYIPINKRKTPVTRQE